MSIIFVDTETTGTDPNRHEIWDLALIEEDGTEHQWFFQPEQPERADPTALRIGGYYERIQGADVLRFGLPPALVVARLTAGKHLAGIVPSFDAAFLERFLRNYDVVPAWHHQLIDVEVVAAGWLLGARPWRYELELPLETDRIASGLGLDAEAYERHTALGDARQARDMWRAVHGLTVESGPVPVEAAFEAEP